MMEEGERGNCNWRGVAEAEAVIEADAEAEAEAEVANGDGDFRLAIGEDFFDEAPTGDKEVEEEGEEEEEEASSKMPESVAGMSMETGDLASLVEAETGREALEAVGFPIGGVYVPELEGDDEEEEEEE